MTYLFFTDLDGTLLDYDTHSYKQALEGITMLREKSYQLVFVSSKTFPEIKVLHEELGMVSPFIFENGGGVCWPDGVIEYLGGDVSELRRRKNILEAAFREPVWFITDMDIGEIARRTGLTRELAKLAQQRSASLPFILPSGRPFDTDELPRLNSELLQKGLAVTKGDRFFHFMPADVDKGKAVIRLIEYYRRGHNGEICTVGIGDSENDIAMLREVDIPVVVKKRDGSVIETGIENIRVTEGIGPRGFSEAVKMIIVP
ncbi:MAG: hypothetical protein A2176_02510 [Spirochaetes bacterium RBG_13_51_14]|nr:MAG: hypothetical protein A2176_02510 [Spirochaetes bacterium RBG_13_51_14]